MNCVLCCCAGGRAAGDTADAAVLNEVGDTRCHDRRICDDRWQRPGSLHIL